MLKKSVLVAIAAAVVLSSGCSYNKANKTPMLSSTPRLIVQTAIKKGMDSAHIKNMSTAAEDIYTSADALNWNNAAKINAMLKTSLNQTESMLIQPVVQKSMTSDLKATLNQLEIAIKNKNSFLSKKYANQLYKGICNLTSSNTNTVTNINNVKYLCRAISLNCDSGNVLAVGLNTASLIKCWNAAKPSVSSIFYTDCVKTQGIVNSLNRCVSAKDLSKTKGLCSELVNQSTVIQNKISNRKV
jgi:hypothetical protein